MAKWLKWQICSCHDLPCYAPLIPSYSALPYPTCHLPLLNTWLKYTLFDQILDDVNISQTYDLFRASSTVWLIIMGIICVLEFLLTIVIYFIYKREKKLSHNIENATTAHNVSNIQNVASTNPFDQN